jgi:hypothetical protein
MTKNQFLGSVLAASLAVAVCSLTPALHSQTAPSSRADVSSPDVRSTFATNLEGRMRAQGTDVSVQLDGEALDSLRIEWPTIHRSDIYRFVTSAAAEQARRMGFTSVVFTNGSRRWEYSLTRESMISSPEIL